MKQKSYLESIGKQPVPEIFRSGSIVNVQILWPPDSPESFEERELEEDLKEGNALIFHVPDAEKTAHSHGRVITSGAIIDWYSESDDNTTIVIRTTHLYKKHHSNRHADCFYRIKMVTPGKPIEPVPSSPTVPRLLQLLRRKGD